MHLAANVSRQGLMMAMGVVLLGAGLCYLVLEAGHGFDDANITINYAQNLAAGHGYVYYIGGERVEGSTSPLWTAINVAAVLLPGAVEMWLTLLGGLIAFATILLTMHAARDLAQLYGRPELRLVETFVALFYLALPSTIGWFVWSLMDIGLWILLVGVAFWLSVRIALGTARRLDVATFPIVLALLSLTRPEGIAAALGFGVLVGLSSFATGKRAGVWVATIGILSAIASFAALIVARYSYFGEFVPNTYYAKTTTNLGEQVLIGLGYFGEYLTSPVTLAIIVLLILLPINAKRRETGEGLASPVPLIMAGVTIVAGLSVYIALGGDHFGSFRFFQFLYPIALPFVAVSLLFLWPNGAWVDTTWTRRRLIAVGLGIFVLWGWFVENKGGYRVEFRVSAEGRAVGEILNGYPGLPSVGTVPAGGISVTYDGPIYDLLGLNWVEMARAGRENAPSYINHGGFDRGVFYATLPDIVNPQLRPCDEDTYRTEWFISLVLGNLFQEDQFRELYEFECWRGIRYFRRADFPAPPD